MYNKFIYIKIQIYNSLIYIYNKFIYITIQIYNSLIYIYNKFIYITNLYISIHSTLGPAALVVRGAASIGAAGVGVPVEVVHLPRMLAEGAHRVLQRREPRGVEEAHGAIPGGGDTEGVMGLGPRAVEECVGGREGEDRRWVRQR